MFVSWNVLGTSVGVSKYSHYSDACGHDNTGKLYQICQSFHFAHEYYFPDPNIGIYWSPQPNIAVQADTIKETC